VIARKSHGVANRRAVVGGTVRHHEVTRESPTWGRVKALNGPRAAPGYGSHGPALQGTMNTERKTVASPSGIASCRAARVRNRFQKLRSTSVQFGEKPFRCGWDTPGPWRAQFRVSACDSPAHHAPAIGRPGERLWSWAGTGSGSPMGERGERIARFNRSVAREHLHLQQQPAGPDRPPQSVAITEGACSSAAPSFKHLAPDSRRPLGHQPLQR